MTFKKTEKEIIKAIVKYGNNEKSLAEVLHQSKLLEKKGIAIIDANNKYYVFLDKEHYDDEETNKAFGYISELMSLVDMLIERRLIVLIPFGDSYCKCIGVSGLRCVRLDEYTNDAGDTIYLADRFVNWSRAGQQKCWSFDFNKKQMPLSHFFNCPFTVSQELRDLVKHNFKSAEDRRFIIQRRLTWLSILVALFIGLLGLVCK